MVVKTNFLERCYNKYVYGPLDDYKFKNWEGESDMNKVVMYAWARARYMNPNRKIYGYSTMLRFIFFIPLEKIKYLITHKVPEIIWKSE